MYSLTENTTDSDQRLNRCLAELIHHAQQYTGGFIQTGDRVRGSYEGSRYLGLQVDGSYVWMLGHEGDAEDCRDDFMRLVENHGLDVEMSIHPYWDGRAALSVRFLEVES